MKVYFDFYNVYSTCNGELFDVLASFDSLFEALYFVRDYYLIHQFTEPLVISPVVHID